MLNVLASLQTIIQPKLVQTDSLTGQPGDEVAQPGLFESIMNELTEAMTAEEPQVPAVPETREPVIAFAGSSFVVPPVIEPAIEPAEEVPETETAEPEPEALPEAVSADEEAVTWPEDDTEQAEAPSSAITKAVHEFAQRVKDFLAGEVEDIDADEIAERIIDGTNLDEAVSELPEGLRQDIARIAENILRRLEHEDTPEEQPVIRAVRITRKSTEEVQPAASGNDSDEEEESETAEDEPEISLEGTDWAGLAEVLNAQMRDLQSRPASDTQTGITDTDQPMRPTLQIPIQPRETPADRTDAVSPAEDSDAPEQPETAQTFRDAAVARTAEHETTSGQDQQGQSQPQNQDSGEQGSTSRSTSTRSRTDTRRVETARSQTPERTSSTATHRTDSHSDFAAYFEGVMTSRRSDAPASPMPFNLRGTADFSQAATLRNGLTNIVRFVRADGVQKASVIVDPPALGRISVELTSGTSGVEASIKVSSEQIRQLVQDQLSELRMNLSQQGVQVAAFTVDVQQDSSGNQQNPQYQSQERGYSAYAGGLDDDDEAEEFRIDLEEGLLYWVA